MSEVAVKSLIRNLSGEIFVDVGANVGDYTLLTWRRYRVNVASEPFPPTRRAMEKRIGWRRHFHHFIILDCALADTVGKTTFYLNPDGTHCNGSADTIEREFHYRPASHPEINRIFQPWITNTGITVPVSTLDYCMKQLDGALDVKIGC